MKEQLQQYLSDMPELASALGLLVTAWIAYFLASRVLLVAVRTLASRTAHTWDDALIENKVGSRLAQLLPALVIYIGADLVPVLHQDLRELVMNFVSAYMIVVVTITLISVLNALNDIYEAKPETRNRPLDYYNL